MSEFMPTSTAAPSQSIYPGEPHEWVERGRGSVAKRALEQVHFTLMESHEAYSSMRRLNDTLFAHYTNQRLKLATKGTQIPTGQAMEIVDTYRAEFMSKLFTTRPLCALRGRNPEDIEGARSSENLLQYGYDFMDAYSKYDNLTFSTCLYGTGVAKVFWVTKTALVPVPGISNPDGSPMFTETLAYRGPWVEPIFIYDVYPSKYKTFIDDDYPICTLTWRSYDHFRNLARRGIYHDRAVRKIKDKVPEQLVPMIGDKYYQQEQRATLGYSDDSRTEPDGILTIEWEGKFRPSLKEPAVQSVITVANGVVVRAEPTPFVSKENSLIWMVMDRLPGQLYGQSLIGKNLPQIHAANVALNLMLTNAADTVRGEKLFRPDLLKHPAMIDDPTQRSHELKRHADPKLAVSYVEKPSLGRDIVHVLGYEQEATSRGAKTTDLKMGRLPRGQRTATETSTAMDQISQTFMMLMQTIEATGVKPMTRKMHKLNQQFLDVEMVYMILDTAGVYFPQNVTPEHLAVDPDFIPLASQREANKALVVSQLQNAIKILMPLAQQNPKYMAIVDEFLVRMFQEQSFQDIDKIKRILTAGGMNVPALPAPGQGAPGRGAPGVANVRRDNRTPEPSNLSGLIKSMGGRLSNVGR